MAKSKDETDAEKADAEKAKQKAADAEKAAAQEAAEKAAAAKASEAEGDPEMELSAAIATGGTVYSAGFSLGTKPIPHGVKVATFAKSEGDKPGRWVPEAKVEGLSAGTVRSLIQSGLAANKA